MADFNENFLNDLNNIGRDLPAIPSLDQLKSDIDLPEEMLTKPGAVNFPQGTTGIDALPSVNDLTGYLDSLGNMNDANNPDVRGKTQNFDAGLDGYQFERYYSHPLFEELGFSAMRNNETLYNEKSHIGHEMVRMLPQFGSQFLTAVVDAATWGGTTDQEAAKKMERAMKIGSSTMGGATGFTTNLALNFGYTAGIIGELAAEEIILGAATALSGGLLGETTIPLMFARGVRGADKISDATKIAKNVYRTLENLQDAEKARSYFNKAVTATGRFVNPLQATTDFVRGVDHVNDIRNLAKTAKGFGSFYGDLRGLRLAWGESSLEGGMVTNDLEKEIYADFKKQNNGQPLTEEQLKIVKEKSKEAGVTTTLQNMPAIFYSQRIVLDPILKGLPKGIFDDAIKFTGKTKAGKFAKTELDGKTAFEFIEDNWKGRLKEFKKPKNYAKAAAFYLKDNLAEGLQETYQESISGANKEFYFDEATKGTPLEGSYLSYITDNLQKMTTTAEGGEVFLSGFLMGTLAGGSTRVVGSLFDTTNYTRYINPENFDKIRREDDANIEKTLTTLNDFSGNFDKYLKEDLYHLIAQDKLSKGMKTAADNGDVKAYIDLKDSSFFKGIYNVLGKGGLDPFLENLEGYKSLTKEEIEKEWGVTQDEFYGAIDSAITNAKRIEARYNVAMNQMRNPFNPGKYNKDKEPELFEEEMFNYSGWKEAQENFIFLQHSFDRQLNRITSLSNEIQQDAKLGELPASEFSTLFDFKSITTEKQLLDAEIKSAEGLQDPKIKRDLTNKKQKFALLEKYEDAMKTLETFFEVNENGEYFLNTEDGKKAFTKAKDTYRRYLRHLAKDRYYTFDDALDKSFEKLVDLYLNKKESIALNQSINNLLNPGAFTRLAERFSNLNKFYKQNEQQRWRDSLNKFVKANYLNSTLQNMYETYGVYADPEELKLMMDKGVFPKTFYKVNEKIDDEIEQLEKTDPVHKQVENYLRNAFEKLMGIPVVEYAPDAYGLTTREKEDSDNRKYNDLAKQFGFSPTELSSVTSVRTLLEAVANSKESNKESTKGEAMLARALLRTVDDNSTITFVQNLDKPFVKTDEGYFIDARYASEDYTLGVFPLEVIILKAELARRMSDSVASDEAFAKSLTTLFEAASKHFEDTRTPGATEFLGLNSIEDFAVEAMTNSEFQSFLSGISYTGGTKVTTAWQGFVNSVLDLLKKLGIVKSGTMLNEALAIITTKIDDIGPIKVTPGKPIPGASVVKDFKVITEKGVEVEEEGVYEHLINNLGWSVDRYSKLSVKQRVDIANKNITQEEFDALEAGEIAGLASKEILNEAFKVVSNEINELINGAKTFDQLKDIENLALPSLLSTEHKVITHKDGSPYTYYDILKDTGIKNPTKFINDKINVARKDLITKFTLADIKVGAVVKLKTNQIVEVIGTTDDGYIGKPINPAENNVAFIFEDIKYVKTEAMKDYKLDDIADVPDDVEIVTEDDSKVSDQSLQNADAELSDDDLDQMINNKPNDNINDIANIC